MTGHAPDPAVLRHRYGRAARTYAQTGVVFAEDFTDPDSLARFHYDIAHRDDSVVNMTEWPADHAPVRIALLGDLHVGAPFISLEKIEVIVDMIHSQSPDAVVLLGDYVVHGVIGGSDARGDDEVGVVGGLRKQFRHVLDLRTEVTGDIVVGRLCRIHNDASVHAPSDAKEPGSRPHRGS